MLPVSGLLSPILLLLPLLILALFLCPRLKQANPNEWLIIINKGEQRLAGVGLKSWVWPMETAVTYPSVMTKVKFDAMQTTSEMQGVKVSGFAIFSVLRTEDGPFRYYKYMQGAGNGMAEENLKGMAESLMRKHVATTTLSDVLRDREALRQTVRDEMMETTKGWGVWLETLEITDVQICSNKLFEDLQAEFRQDAHVKAEQVRLASSKLLAEQQAAHDEELTALNCRTALAKNKAEIDEETSRAEYEGDAQLARAQQQVVLANKQLEVEEQKMETERKLEFGRQKLRHDLQSYGEDLHRQRHVAEHAHEMQLKKAELEVDGNMSERAMQVHAMKHTADIYEKLPLKEFKVHNFVSPDSVSGGGLAALLPGISALSQVARPVDDRTSPVAKALPFFARPVGYGARAGSVAKTLPFLARPVGYGTRARPVVKALPLFA